MQLLIVASIHYDIYVLKSSKQAKLGFGKPKSKNCKFWSWNQKRNRKTFNETSGNQGPGFPKTWVFARNKKVQPEKDIIWTAFCEWELSWTNGFGIAWNKMPVDEIPLMVV